MQKLTFPHVILPPEFVALLKENQSTTSSVAAILELKKTSPAIYLSMEEAFGEFNEGKGIENAISALGWIHFRERLSSMYIYKSIHGLFPIKTDLQLIESIMQLEARFINHTIQGISRIYLLGFYMRLANIQNQKRLNNKFFEIRVPEEINAIFKASQVRSEKIDLLIIMVMHMSDALGTKFLQSLISTGKKFNEIYDIMSAEARSNMNDNLLAYGASIQESDIFLYEKV
jgi:hypothetical protein